jgi:hypothetical protein
MLLAIYILYIYIIYIEKAKIYGGFNLHTKISSY